jgi:hypothetical protein
MRDVTPALRATVPKTAVNKNSQTLPSEAEVWATWNTCQMTFPPAEAQPDKVRSNAHFR